MSCGFTRLTGVIRAIYAQPVLLDPFDVVRPPLVGQPVPLDPFDAVLPLVVQAVLLDPFDAVALPFVAELPAVPFDDFHLPLLPDPYRRPAGPTQVAVVRGRWRDPPVASPAIRWAAHLPAPPVCCPSPSTTPPIGLQNKELLR